MSTISHSLAVPRARQLGRLALAASASCNGPKRRRPRRNLREGGVALVVVMSVIAILTIYLTEMLQNNATAFHIAVSQRDKLKAEYIAKSGLNLTRLLIANEPPIRKVVAPFYQMLLSRTPPQLNVWTFADDLLAPFFSPAMADEIGSGMDFSQMQGIVETGGTVEVLAVPENSKINVSNALFYSDERARLSLALQLFTLMGGGQVQSPYDPMFDQEDADGRYSTRLDIVSAIIDWWDLDQSRTVYDPGAGAISTSGSEGDSYSQLREPYRVKNAPLDSLEELRLVRGIGDDFWANFVETDPTDPRTRNLTVYGSGAVNPNEATPQVLLARLCSFLGGQPLCMDTMQQAAFIQLFNTARAFMPVALFSAPGDFLDFVSGNATSPSSPYGMLQQFLGPSSPLMAWQPLVIPPDRRQEIASAFIVRASIFTIQSTGRVGRAEVRLSSVVNFHDAWTPPPGVAAKMPSIGIFLHYRVN